MSGDHAGPAATIAARVRHVEALLEQRGLVDSQELDRALEAFLARASPANGARLVARAWLDEGFRALRSSFQSSAHDGELLAVEPPNTQTGLPN